jgi:hypothetical protein
MLDNFTFSKTQIEDILRDPRTMNRLGKSALVVRGAKLKKEFEIQLKTLYPPSGDPVWQDAQSGLKPRDCYAEMKWIALAKTQLEESERVADRMQLQLNQGLVTEANKTYFELIRKVQEVPPSYSTEQVTALLEGRARQLLRRLLTVEEMKEIFRRELPHSNEAP